MGTRSGQRSLGRLLNTALEPFGWRLARVDAARDRQDEVTLETYRRYYPAASIEGRRFYNLGAGGFRHRLWTNIDKLSSWYSPVQGHPETIDYDFFSMEPLPLEPQGAELFYSSHAIEHVPDREAAFLFAEVHRVLKPGGIFRITCPNADLHYRAIRSGDADYFYFRTSPARNRNPSFDRTPEMSPEQAFIWHIASNASVHHVDGCERPIGDEELQHILREHSKETALDLVTSRADAQKQKRYPGNHINWYTPAKLEAMLREAGFAAVSREAYGQSRSPVMRDLTCFDRTHPKLSLYLEALKAER